MSVEFDTPGKPELVDVVWKRFGQHVFLTYADASREHMNGDVVFATDMAEDAGLELVRREPAITHWAKASERVHFEPVPLSRLPGSADVFT